MIELNKKEKIERIKLFLEEKTYTYIQDIYDYHFNGFIKEIDNTKIIFLDDVLGKIPIMISAIKIINYSNKRKNE